MLTTLVSEREAGEKVIREIDYKMEQMRQMFDRMSIQEQMQMLTRDKIEFYIEKKITDATNQLAQQNHALDVRLFEAAKKFDIMKMALEQMKFEIVQMIYDKFGTLDQREIELKMRENSMLQREFQMQMDKKEQDMKIMMAEMSNESKLERLELMENHLKFEQRNKNFSVLLQRHGYQSIGDYLRKTQNFDDTRYLPNRPNRI